MFVKHIVVGIACDKLNVKCIGYQTTYWPFDLIQRSPHI